MQDESWHVLYVDDDEDDYIILREMLAQSRSHRFSLDWASSYEQGRAKLSGSTYRAVLVDYDLGDHTGIELIREYSPRSNTPFILFSGRGSYEVDLEAQQAGATIYLTKAEANALLLERVIRYAIERKLSEDAVRRSEERLRRAVYVGHMLMWERDLRSGEMLVSGDSRAILGVEPVTSADQIQALLHPDDWEKINRAIQQLVETGGECHIEYRILRPDRGEIAWIEDHISCIQDENGQAIFLTGASVEVTERKRRELNMALLAEISEELTHMASPHDLMALAAKRMAQYFGVERLAFLEVDANRNIATGLYSLFNQGEEEIGAFSLSEYASEEVVAELSAGRVMVMDDLSRDEHAVAFQESHIGAQILVPYAPDGRLTFTLAIQHDRPYHWREDEIELVKELSYRIFNGLEHFRDEKARRESEAHLRLATEAAEIYWWEIDLFQQTFRISENASRLVGQVLPCSLSEVWAAIHPDDLPRAYRTFVNSIETSGEFKLEMRVVWADQEYWVTTAGVALPEHDDFPARVVGIVEDITAQKRNEQAILQSRERINEILESITDGFLELDRAWTFTYANHRAARNVGHEPEELIGKNLWEMFPALIGGEQEKLLRKVMKERQPVHAEIHGEITGRWYEYHMYPSLAGLTVFWSDVTGRKQAERDLQHYAAALERSNQALRDFTFIASHDLQEPLRKVQAFGRLLVSRYSDTLGEEGKDYIYRMTSAADRMNSMLQGLLAYSRVTSQGVPFTEVDLARVANGVLMDLEGRLLETHGQVELCELPVIHADPLQMHQLLQNLISNSLKYHRPGVAPLVRLHCRVREDHCLEMVIADNGIGFDMREVSRIFDPFARLGKRSDFEGSGMGLAICKKIVERHAGTITAEGVPGEGATFTVILPLK